MSERTDTRQAIVEAAAELLGEGGAAAMTTRGVAERAGVQAPTIYRLFGDKDGLLEAVAEHVLHTFVTAKTAGLAAAQAAGDHLLEDFRSGWRRQVEFGLAHPAVFAMMVERGTSSAAVRAGRDVLAARVHRLAAAGLLQVPEPRAVDLVHATATGAIQALLSTPPDDRDPGLAEAMMEAALAAVLVPGAKDRADSGPAGDPAVAAAVALRALVPGLDVLSAAERALLAQWLDRVAYGRTSPDS
ncbi:TetR/AcrR family transcriptional regulator [Nocardioides zeicaulis]|uniref:TetR/AcrR family transcriptional regulator n=1 Tax=Nocardioides zeicaulis TaxID=1776857 RepID=A0ABV6E2K8_9ACTN